MAATVDYLFAFAATTGAVLPQHFEALFDAYLADDANRAVLSEANPAALAEMAATVDYLFAFAATTGAVLPQHFEVLFDAYLADDANRAFLADANPAALAEMAERFREALDRGLWQSGRNDLYDRLNQFAKEGRVPRKPTA